MGHGLSPDRRVGPRRIGSAEPSACAPDRRDVDALLRTSPRARRADHPEHCQAARRSRMDKANDVQTSVWRAVRCAAERRDDAVRTA